MKRTNLAQTLNQLRKDMVGTRQSEQERQDREREKRNVEWEKARKGESFRFSL